MTPNNNLNPLAFYKSQNDMFRARPYNYGIKYPLYMPLNRVTPFQIIRGSSESTTLTSAKIYNDRGVEVATVTSYMSVNVVTIGSSKVMQFKCGNYANLTPGQYTMRVVIGNDTYYSEVFTAYANIGKLVKVEYYNADPIIFDEGALTYDNGFKFELYLCTEIAKPEYLFEEESTKRGGFTFVENQISSKQYKMVIAAPEYLCDAIRIIRLHDHVAITKDGNAYEAYNFTPSYQWNDVGDLAQVTITFESNTVLQKISAYKGSQSVFKNALLAAASVPIMFSPNVIAQYGASVDGVAEAYTEFTGKLIRQLEEQTTLPKEAWVAIDTGTGEAKKMSIGLLGGGTGKPSELWTNDKKIKYLYIKEDNSEAYITKQFIGDSNIMAKGDIVAYASGNYDISKPLAGYDAVGMSRYDKTQFEVVNGLVRIIDGGGGGTIAGIEITGNGNAFTNASMKNDNTVISFDKGITFWHAGNDGVGSGLDADLLDGWHLDAIRRRVWSFENYDKNSENEYNPNDITYGGMMYNYENMTNWLNMPSGFSYGSVIRFCPYQKHLLNGMLAWDINHNSTTDVTRKLYFRANGNVNNVNTWGKWHEIAFTDGNIASATKLQTTRTIWGQNFNGTQNVSGNMTGVGNITMSGNIYMGNNRNIYAKNPDGSDMAIFYTNTNSELVIGAGNTQKGTNTYLSGYEIIFRTSTDLNERMRISANGNVGIGTSSPSEMLEVNGHIKCGHVYPRANNTYNVGLTGTRFANGYFTQRIYVGDANTSANSNSSNTFISKGSIELNASTPYIDFHYSDSTSDYTHRIIAQSGNLQITPSVSIGGSCYPTNSTTCMLGTSSLRWVRLYLTGVNGNWISGKTYGAIMIDSTSISTSTYFPLYRWKTYTGRVFNLGGLQGTDSSHQFGFYMFDKDQTENRTNASFYMYSNGNMNGTHSLIMQQDVVAYGSSSYNITSPTAGYDALGLARFDSTCFTVSSGYVTLKASATSPIRSVTATTLNPGSNANASWNSSTGALSLGIPRGNTGATGTQGASVTYQWSGTSLRMGVTPYGGSTSWGSYVNLKGATGSPGPSWNGGVVTNNITIKATWGALGLSGGTNNFYLSQRGDNIVYFCFGGTNNNKGSFSPSGNMYVSGSYSNGSDIRLKYRLEDISDILGKIKDISAFYYIRKDLNDGVIRIGVSAQDVIKQFPQVVSNNSINGKEYYSVEYATLGVAIAVNGLKEVHQLVKDNKNEIDLLKIEIASLKERLAKLEAA